MSFRILFSSVFAVIIIIGFSANIVAQSLSFSQAMIVTASSTVPAGKVWKIESVLYQTNHIPSYPSNSQFSHTSAFIQINGINICTRAVYSIEVSGPSGGDGGGISSGEVTRLPIWLPEAATLAPGSNSYGINVIEFNVVP